MNKSIGLLLVFLLVVLKTNAQNDCNCANTQKPQAYKAKVDKGENVQVNAQCATLALYLCMCECPTTGVSRQQLESNIKQLSSDIKTWEQLDGKTYYPGLPVNKQCPKAGTAKSEDVVGNSQQIKQPTAADNNKDAVSFANSLGTLTNDPNAQQELEKINNRHQAFDNAKSTAASLGANEKQLSTIDNLETVAHLGSFFLNNGATDDEIAKNAEIRKAGLRSANTVSNRMDKLSDELKKLHNAKIPDYDNTTAKYRLLYLRFLLVPNKEEDDVFFTEDKFQKLVAEVESVAARGLPYLKNEIDKVARDKKIEKEWLEYLRNRRTNDTSEAYTHFIFPSTFNVSKDKVFKIEKIGDATIKKLIIYKTFVFDNDIFETKDINKSWDGAFKKVPQPSGEYKYSLEGYDSFGQYFLRKGSFMLIRE